MFPLLFKYLMQQEKVCIQGVGIFTKQRKPAQLNFASKTFLPPGYIISFTEDPVKADRHFFAFISKEKGVDEVEAIRYYHDFSYRFKDHINHHNETDLPGLGVMKKHEDGRLFFQPENLLENYFPATPAERIVRENTHHSLLVGDTQTTNTQMQEKMVDDTFETTKSRWWIAALVIAVIAIAAIIYYYMQHGGIRL